MTPLSQLVRNARSRRDMTLRDLGRKVDVDPSFLSRIEHGEHVRVSADTLSRLASALGLRADDVFRSACRLPPDVEAYVLENLTRIRRRMAAA